MAGVNNMTQNPSFPAGVQQDLIARSAVVAGRIGECSVYVERAARLLVTERGGTPEAASEVAEEAAKTFATVATAGDMAGSAADEFAYVGAPASLIATFTDTAFVRAFESLRKAERHAATDLATAARAAWVAVEQLGGRSSERVAIVAAAVAGAAAAVKVLASPGVSTPKKESR